MTPRSPKNNSLGYVTFALHSHLPYVVNHGTWPHGMEWLHEAAAETYLPLLRIFSELEQEGLALNANVNLSPILLQQNRREIHVRVQCQALLLQFAEDPQQGQVGFRRCFMQPFHSVGPSPMVDYIGQVGMQSKCHIPQRIVLRTSWSHFEESAA